MRMAPWPEARSQDLADLKQRNPAHCSGSQTYVGHQMSPELYEKVESIEDEIEALKQRLAKP